MALWVEEATENILKAAKQEFIEQGFINASLRTIAVKANTSPRSIYTRFSNKEELFSYFVEPHKEYFLNKFKEYLNRFDSQSVEEQASSRKDESRHCLYEITEYVYANFDEFYLLICCSEGTKYENFIEELAYMEATYTIKYMQDTQVKEMDIDHDFIHIMSRSFFDGYFEIIRHRYNLKKAKDFIDRLLRFSEGGWSQFLE